MSENTPVDAPNIEVSFSGTTFADAEFVTKKIDPEVKKDLEGSGSPDPVEIDQKPINTTQKPAEKQPENVNVNNAASEADKIMSDKEIKKLKAKFGESEFDIFADALVTHKVDGKDVEVTVQELLNNYSGKVAYDKRFSELDKERKNHKKEVEMVNEYVRGFSQLVEKKDIMGALAYVAQFTGKDPISFRKEVRDSLLTQLESYITMTPEERQFAELKEERDLLQQQRQSDTERAKAEQSSKALADDLRQIQETHGLDDARIVEIANTLEPMLAARGKTLDDLTPKDLLDFHIADVTYKRVEDALEKVQPGLGSDDDVVEIFYKKVTGNREITDQQLDEEIHKLLRIPKSKKPNEVLVDKLSKNQPSKVQPKQASKEADQVKQALTFADLDF